MMASALLLGGFTVKAHQADGNELFVLRSSLNAKV